MRRPTYTKAEQLLGLLLDALNGHLGTNIELAKENATTYMKERRKKFLAQNEAQVKEMLDSIPSMQKQERIDENGK